MDRMNRILYRLNEGNANNPADLLVGQHITMKQYDADNKLIKEMDGTLESITNDYVIVRDYHTQKPYSYRMKEFNAFEKAIEFVCVDDPNLKFFY